MKQISSNPLIARLQQKQFYHLNDRTLKYMSLAQPKRQHQYLELPGEYKASYPQEIVFPDLNTGRADMFYINDQEMFFNIEEETKPINDETLEKFSRYVVFAAYMYSSNVYLGVICHTNPKKEFKCFQLSPSIIIKVHYFYFTPSEILEKYENIINKVEQKQQLSDMEALDIAFISKFAPKKDVEKLIKSLANLFGDVIINDLKLKLDVAVIFSGMILKYISDVDEQIKLLEMVDMRQYIDIMEELVYDEYGDQLKVKDDELKEKDDELKVKDGELKEKDDEINELKEYNKQYKNAVNNAVKELSQIDGLPPKAMSIINNLMVF